MRDSKGRFIKGHKPYPKTEEVIKRLRERMTGSRNAFFGKKHSEETKARWSLIRTGRVLSKELKEKISKSLKKVYADGIRKNYLRDTSLKKRISDSLKVHWENNPHPMLGKKHSLETRKRMSESRKRMNIHGAMCASWKGGVSKQKGYRSLIERRRYIRKMGNGGTHTLSEWEALKMKYRYMCLCCKKREPEIKLTEDHIVPLSKGGRNDIDNIQPLCQACNTRKKDKRIIYEFNL